MIDLRAAGFTEDEIKAWELLADAATAIMTLPSEHPMERAELASAIHVVQRAIMARPTRRRMEAGEPGTMPTCPDCGHTIDGDDCGCTEPAHDEPRRVAS